MTTPADDISLDLVPNADDDDPKHLAAVRARIIELAKAYGIPIQEEPSAIEADANKNSERAAKIRENLNHQLMSVSVKFCKERTIELDEFPDGTAKRRETRVLKASAELGVTLKELYDLCTSGISTGFSLASKLVSWIYEQVPSRKR